MDHAFPARRRRGRIAGAERLANRRDGAVASGKNPARGLADFPCPRLNPTVAFERQFGANDLAAKEPS